jgi:hypothetical protein
MQKIVLILQSKILPDEYLDFNESKNFVHLEVFSVCMSRSVSRISFQKLWLCFSSLFLETKTKCDILRGR